MPATGAPLYVACIKDVDYSRPLTASQVWRAPKNLTYRLLSTRQGPPHPKPITVNHSHQDPRYTQKPIYYTILAKHIWSSLLCSPEIAVKTKGESPVFCQPSVVRRPGKQIVALPLAGATGETTGLCCGCCQCCQ